MTQAIQQIQLNKLIPSEANVRHTGRMKRHPRKAKRGSASRPRLFSCKSLTNMLNFNILVFCQK
jgi:hypothetical protein